MDEQITLPDAPGAPSIRRYRPYLLILAGLFFVHAALTLQLFGPGDPFPNLLSEEPITSGRHALHLHQGGQGVGARTVAEPARYDPSYFAGYPPTPVVDAEARPLNWYRLLRPGRSPAVAYKVGLAMTWWLVPVGLWAAAVALRLGRPCEVTAAALAVLVAWLAPVRDLVDSGDLCVPFVGVTAVLGAALLGRWHVSPTLFGWLGLTAVGACGWVVEPPMWLAAAVVGLGCWVTLGHGHSWPWHVGLAASHAVAVALTISVWDEWARDWWVRLPFSGAVPSESFPGPSAALPADPFGGPVGRLVAGLLWIAAVVGGWRRWAAGRRCPSAATALGAAGALALAAAGGSRGSFVPLSSAQLCVLGLCLAVVPAAVALTGPATALAVGVARPHVGLVVGGGLFLLVAGLLVRRPLAGERPAWGPRPLTIGLPADARKLEEMLGRVTTADARVLWEDVSRRHDLGWTAILSRRLARAFIGGLDPAGRMEHAACGLRDGTLAGRALAGWSDVELDGYCRRYNVGWVVCATDPTGDRFARWPAAEALSTPDGAGAWRVFAVRRPHSFVLKGHAARFETAGQRVTLADVVPEDGEVVLSLHYQAGWHARPSSVRVERELDPFDPIPFVRLRMTGPAGRVTLTWSEH